MKEAQVSQRRQRTYRTHAVVLKRRDHADADRILTIFTPRNGKIELIAKGIRKTMSRKAGHLELFSHPSLLVAQARAWDIVTEASTVESFRHIRENLENFAHAAYACELVDRFTEIDDENEALWDLLLLVLRWLDHHSSETANASEGDQNSFDTGVLMRWFELQLLASNGYQPELFRCLTSGEPLKAEVNYLSISEGGVYSPKFGANREDVEQVDPDVLKILRYFQRNSWVEVHKLSVRAHTMARIENILYRLILSILERQLKSVDFLRKLRSMNK